MPGYIDLPSLSEPQVRTIGPFSVTATECSKCALGHLSAVTTVLKRKCQKSYLSLPKLPAIRNPEKSLMFRMANFSVSLFQGCRWPILLLTITVYLSLVAWHATAMQGKLNCFGSNGVYSAGTPETACSRVEEVSHHPANRSCWQRINRCFRSGNGTVQSSSGSTLQEVHEDDVMSPEEEGHRWQNRGGRRDVTRKTAISENDLLMRVHSQDPETRRLIKQLLKKPILAAKVFKLLENSHVRRFLEVFPELPSDVQKKFFAKYKDKCPEEYRITTLRGARKIELVADFPRSANMVFSERNIHYLPHLVTNVILFMSTALLSGYEQAFVPGFLYRGARVMVLENDLSSSCNALARGDTFNINAPITGSLFQRLQLQSGSFDRGIAIGASIALVPVLLRPALMPFVTFGWLLGAKGLEKIANRVRQPGDAATLTQLAATIQEFNTVNDVVLLEQLQEPDVRAGLVTMTENPKETLKLMAMIAELDQSTQLELLQGLITVDGLNISQTDTRGDCTKFVHRYLNVDHSPGQRPWSTNIPTALYQLIFRRESWYVALVTGLTIALLVHGGAIAGVGRLAPYIATLGGNATIAPPATLNISCVTPNLTNVQLVGDLISLDQSAVGTVSNFYLNLLTDVMLNGIYRGCQAICLGVALGVKRCFRYCLRLSREEDAEALQTLMPSEKKSSPPAHSGKSEDVDSGPERKTTEV